MKAPGVWGGATSWEDDSISWTGIVLKETWLGPTYVEKRTDELWFVSILKGVTLIKQTDGTWVQRVTPQDSEVRDAVKAYRGGYAYELSISDVDELTAAGFGGFIA